MMGPTERPLVEGGRHDTKRKPFVLGAVAYDPKVVTIWEGFKAWLAEHGFAFDYVLYSNYGRHRCDRLASGDSTSPTMQRRRSSHR
jgi:hypothetical protein